MYLRVWRCHRRRRGMSSVSFLAFFGGDAPAVRLMALAPTPHTPHQTTGLQSSWVVLVLTCELVVSREIFVDVGTYIVHPQK